MPFEVFLGLRQELSRKTITFTETDPARGMPLKYAVVNKYAFAPQGAVSKKKVNCQGNLKITPPTVKVYRERTRVVRQFVLFSIDLVEVVTLLFTSRCGKLNALIINVLHGSWFKCGSSFSVITSTQPVQKRTWIFSGEIFGNLPKPDFKGTKNGRNRQLFFWSKEKEYGGFIRIRQYTVFTTDYCSNRGLYIPVQSVLYIQYIGLYYTGSSNSHFLLTRCLFATESRFSQICIRKIEI